MHHLRFAVGVVLMAVGNGVLLFLRDLTGVVAIFAGFYLAVRTTEGRALGYRIIHTRPMGYFQSAVLKVARFTISASLFQLVALVGWTITYVMGLRQMFLTTH